MSRPVQLSQRRSRLPRAFSALLGVFGAGWLALTLLSSVSVGMLDLLRAMNMAANIAASVLVCAVAWLGLAPAPDPRTQSRERGWRPSWLSAPFRQP